MTKPKPPHRPRKKKNRAARRNTPEDGAGMSLPTLQQLHEFAAASGDRPTTKQIAKAFAVHPSRYKALRQLLKRMGDGPHPTTPHQGKPQTPPQPASRARRKRAGNHPEDRSGGLPEVAVLIVTKLASDGTLEASPANDAGSDFHIEIPTHAMGKGRAPAVGDHVLTRLSPMRAPKQYRGSVIRVLPKPAGGSSLILGIVSLTTQGGVVEPVSRKDKGSYHLSAEQVHDLADGELVEIEPSKSRGRTGPSMARLVRRLGNTDHPSSASMISIHQHEIPLEFPKEAKAEAERSEPPVLTDGDGRVDMRAIPLVTIDGADARDFDDAVFAEPVSSPDSAEAWHAVVAIADVAHYVQPDSALDEEAQKRGNSVYFPDRVVPMLPEALSNGLCSLNPDEDRHCMAVHLWLDAEGNTLRHRFERGLMRSHRRWTYEQVQKAFDSGDADPQVQNLYAAYAALKKHIAKRAPLDLNLPEFKPEFAEDGNVSNIRKVARVDSHKLIEAFMIAANVAAANELSGKHQRSYRKEAAGKEGSAAHLPPTPAVFRVHEAPDMAKISILKDLLKPSGYALNLNNNLSARTFNVLLTESEEKGEAPIIHTAVLRSQMKAYYSITNEGHFGLSLASYTHFTSPIRRYSDLLVHRGLIERLAQRDGSAAAHNTAKPKPANPAARLKELEKIATHISETERRAMLAERTAMDRYMSAYMLQHVGDGFAAHISGIGRAGLFVAVDDNGADGFIPARTLRDDFYFYDEKRQQLRGKRNGRIFGLGQAVQTVLEEANPVTGSLRFSLQEKTKKAQDPLQNKHRKKPYKRRRK